MGRATSAKTFQTTGTSMKIKEVPTTSSKGNNYGGIPKMRPITAMTRVEE